MFFVPGTDVRLFELGSMDLLWIYWAREVLIGGNYRIGLDYQKSLNSTSYRISPRLSTSQAQKSISLRRVSVLDFFHASLLYDYKELQVRVCVGEILLVIKNNDMIRPSQVLTLGVGI